MSLSESEIIENYLKPIASHYTESIFLDDDVAIFKSGDACKNVISKDIFTQNIHFTIDENPTDIAKRLLMSNISDIASSGSIPKYYLLGMPIHHSLDSEFYNDFCAGLSFINKKYNIGLIGGDTVKVSNDLFFSITIIGETDSAPLLRSQASEDDLIFVTGNVGDSALHLKSKRDHVFNASLSDYECKSFMKSFYDNTIPVMFMNKLSSMKLASSATDISDGLLADLESVCRSSDLSAQLDIKSIQFSDSANRCLESGLTSLNELISGGDDYQMIITAKKSHQKDIFMLANSFKIDLNIIGELVQKRDSFLYDAKGNLINFKYKGYEH